MTTEELISKSITDKEKQEIEKEVKTKMKQQMNKTFSSILGFFIKPWIVIGFIWILIHWTGFTMIPMITYWQSFMLILLVNLLTTPLKFSFTKEIIKDENKNSTK